MEDQIVNPKGLCSENIADGLALLSSIEDVGGVVTWVKLIIPVNLNSFPKRYVPIVLAELNSIEKELQYYYGLSYIDREKIDLLFNMYNDIYQSRENEIARVETFHYDIITMTAMSQIDKILQEGFQ